MNDSKVKPGADVFDDLAGMFLSDAPEVGVSDPEAVGATPNPRPSRCIVTWLLPVNLPVLAGPWVEQAAAMLGRHGRPTALIRRRAGQITVDRLGDWPDQGLAPVTGDVDSFTTSVGFLAQRDPDWMVEVAGSESIDQWQRTRVDRVVLLTGCDQVAVVAAFGQIKELAPHLPAGASIGLIIVGSEGATARNAAARITSACTGAIDCDVQLIGTLERIIPIDLHGVGRFDVSDSSLGTIDRSLGSAIEERVNTPVESAPPPSDGQCRGGADIRLRPALRLAEEFDDPVMEPAPREAERARVSVAAGAASVKPTARQPSVEFDDDRCAEACSGDLSSFVDGLVSLDVRCPHVAAAQFAFDEAGVMHALMRDSGDACLADLHVAAQWAGQNAALIRRVNPWLDRAARRGASETRPGVEMHLFTDRPAQWRRLADGPISLHILIDAARVKPGRPVYLAF